MVFHVLLDTHHHHLSEWHVKIVIFTYRLQKLMNYTFF